MRKRNRCAALLLLVLYAACSGASQVPGTPGASDDGGGAPQGDAATPSPDAGTTPGEGGAAGEGGSPAIDLCAGLVDDKSAHPQSSPPKPAKGASFVEPDFPVAGGGAVKITRLTEVAATGSDPVIKPMYSPVAAWNADESRLMLFNVTTGGHEIYDGKSYAFVASLDVPSADIEQVWWDGADPDVFYYVDRQTFTRYHVSTGAKDAMHVFSFCGALRVGGDSHAFTSWDSRAVGLGCCANPTDATTCTTSFVYELDTDQVLGQQGSTDGPPHMAASGKLTYWRGKVTDLGLTTLRTLELANPDEHSALGMLASGHDTYNTVTYDPAGMTPVGQLVTFDLTTGAARLIVGPGNGYPYPESAVHISPLAVHQRGWVWVSIVGDVSGQGLLDQELVIADTNSGKVCRVAHHRSYGKNNTQLATPYWAEPHVTASPSGTRAVFGSDWNGGPTVDTYVVELPSYAH
jgi:hypothetical protein